MVALYIYMYVYPTSIVVLKAIVKVSKEKGFPPNFHKKCIVVAVVVDAAIIIVVGVGNFRYVTMDFVFVMKPLLKFIDGKRKIYTYI